MHSLHCKKGQNRQYDHARLPFVKPLRGRERGHKRLKQNPCMGPWDPLKGGIERATHKLRLSGQLIYPSHPI